MRPDFVVVLSPFVNGVFCLFKRPELVEVEAVVPELSIEGFYKGILCWCSRLNKLQLDRLVSAPEEHRFARQFGAVIINNCLRAPSQQVHKPSHPDARYRGVDQLANTLAGKVINDVQHPEPAIIS